MKLAQNQLKSPIFNPFLIKIERKYLKIAQNQLFLPDFHEILPEISQILLKIEIKYLTIFHVFHEKSTIL